MSGIPGPAIGLQPGEKGDGTSLSPTSDVPSSCVPSTDGDTVEPKAEVSNQTGPADGDSLPETPILQDEAASAASCSVLTEESLKELLYTSCSSDSPEFGSIINLYLDQVKSRSEEIASMYCKTCDPLETIFKHSGIYSKLDLKNFVRLGPSSIGYPSASWENAKENDRGTDVMADNQKDGKIDTDKKQMRLKLRITRETHPTPEDLRNDIVLKMIVVEEVNKKDLMGPLRAYLSPEGDVEFHSGSPGQKEGLEDFLRSLSKSVAPVDSSDRLSFDIVISAITGYPFETNLDGSSSSSFPLDAVMQCHGNETSVNGELVDGLISKASASVLGTAHELSENIPDAESQAHDNSAHCDIDESDEAVKNTDPVPSCETETGHSALETTDMIIDEVLESALHSVASKQAGKPPLWHQGVDLTEIFSETDSDCDSSDVNAESDIELPTAADLAILELLRSSSPGDSDASGMSGYSEDDIDAGLRRLALGKGEEDGDDEGGSVDAEEVEEEEVISSVTEEEIISDEQIDPQVVSTDEQTRLSSEAISYAAVRPKESPSPELDTLVSLKDIGLQVIDPMGLNVISLLRKMVVDEQKAIKKAEKSKEGEKGSQGKSPAKTSKKSPAKASLKSPAKVSPKSPAKASPKSPASSKPQKSPEKKNGKTKSPKKKSNPSKKTESAGKEENDVLKSLENIAEILIPDEGEDKSGVQVVPKADDANKKIEAEKTVPPILGKVPDPTPHGFSRHLASSHPAGSTNPAAFGLKHPVLGVPLVKSNQWFPLLVQVSNQGRSTVPNHSFLPQPPLPPTTDFRKQIFIKWPDEFGRFVANTLSSMGIEQRARIIEHFIDVLNHNFNSDRFYPQNGSNPSQRMQINPVRPSIRPPFSQTPFGAAIPNMASTSQNTNAQPNFGPHQNFWPPTMFPHMQLSQPQLSSSLQNWQVTENQAKKTKSVPSNDSCENGLLKPLIENRDADKTKDLSSVPSSSQSSSKSPKTSESTTLEPKVSPSKSKPKKASKLYWQELKSFKAAKKAAKRSQFDPKFCGALKNKGSSVYSSPRKSSLSKTQYDTNQNKSHIQSDQSLSQTASDSLTSDSRSSSDPPVKKPEPTKQSPNPKENQAFKRPPRQFVKNYRVAYKGSNQPVKNPVTPNPPKTQPNTGSSKQNLCPSQPKLPADQPPQPSSNPTAQSSKETGACYGNTYKRARKPRKNRQTAAKRE